MSIVLISFVAKANELEHPGVGENVTILEVCAILYMPEELWDIGHRIAVKLVAPMVCLGSIALSVVSQQYK